jgi:homoserine O-acetyltransferase
MAEPASTLAAGSVGTVETQYLDLPEPVRLDCGRDLYPVRVAYETYGSLSPRRDNVILVCHALSGDAHAAGIAKTPPEESTRDGFGAEDRDGASRKGLGWWDGMIGPGKAFDTDTFFVVSTNLLGGCRGTTGPSSADPATGRPYGPDFPVITVADMVRTERAFLDALGIERLAAVAGGSLGGMQAFEWAILFPDQVDAVVAIASTHALHPQGVAWNSIARDAIMRDPAWQGGRYYGTGRRPDAGMGVARMVGHDHRTGVRGRELPAPPGRLVRQALRRQHLPLHVARADLFRSRAPVRPRIARAGARGRLGADAADRVQLRLAVPAVCVG